MFLEHSGVQHGVERAVIIEGMAAAADEVRGRSLGALRTPGPPPEVWEARGLGRRGTF